jgi:hypothetical protein
MQQYLLDLYVTTRQVELDVKMKEAVAIYDTS